jgi:hypothetical protein
MPYKKYYLKLRLTQSELDAITEMVGSANDTLGLTLTQAAHMAIDHWQTLTDIETADAIRSRKHLAIDIPMFDRTIGANKATKEWMDSVDNSSLTASAAIGIWLMRETDLG